MSIDNSISTSDIETCIQVLSKLNSNTNYRLLETDNYDTLRILIDDLFQMTQSSKRKRLQDNHQKTQIK